MSEILGHDVNGRPLRVGDRVVFVDSYAGTEISPVGQKGRVTGRWGPGLDTDIPNPAYPGETYWAPGSQLRRIDDRTDHQPSEYTFDSLMDHLKSGVPA